MAAAGRFIPKFPEKYVGRSVNQIFYRSSWEVAFMKWLDANPAVLRWASEELSIPYIHPKDGRVHQYYPDIVMIIKDVDGQVKKKIIEIKPYKETVPTPRMSPRDAEALIVNTAKWEAANLYAQKNGASFEVLTEKQMFKQRSKKPIGSTV